MLCAAKRCPWQGEDCQGYMATPLNASNPEVLPLIACCKLQCSAVSGAEVGVLALQCGGASSATAITIVMYVLILHFAAFCMLICGSVLSLKRFYVFIILSGTAINQTAVTGIFVTYLTSPFKVLETVIPAVGAMNIAIFSYFFSGFQYSIGVAYEAGPLIALATTAYPIWKAILETPADNTLMRDGSRLSLVAIVVAFLWALHNVSYRILGYRVQWRLSKAPQRQREGNTVNSCFLLGAGQGHPTWRTPWGQTTCILLTTLAWAIFAAVRNDLANRQQCRADWVLIIMLYGPPILMTLAVCHILLIAMRCRTISGVGEPLSFWTDPGRWWRTWWHGNDRRAGHPGINFYTNFREDLERSLKAYPLAVALHRRGRVTYANEVVIVGALEWQDNLIGFLAWVLATLGITVGITGTGLMYVAATMLGSVLEAIGGSGRAVAWWRRQCMWFVRTNVTEQEHKEGALRVLKESYVGVDFGSDTLNKETIGELITSEAGQRYINLPYLLDNISHEELHVLLNE